MKISGKEFDFYWKIIRIPFYLIAAWILSSLIVSMLSFSLYQLVFGGYAAYIIPTAIFVFIGWSAVKDHKSGIKDSAWSGAIAGFMAGALGAVVSILIVYIVPDVMAASVQQAVQSGAQVPLETIESMIRISVLFGLIVSPLINSLFGALIAALAAFISRKV